MCDTAKNIRAYTFPITKDQDVKVLNFQEYKFSVPDENP